MVLGGAAIERNSQGSLACPRGTWYTLFLQKEARPFLTAEALTYGTARAELAPAVEVPLLTGHQRRENYWVQSAVLALEINRGLQSRKPPYKSNKFPLGKKPNCTTNLRLCC